MCLVWYGVFTELPMIASIHVHATWHDHHMVELVRSVPVLSVLSYLGTRCPNCLIHIFDVQHHNTYTQMNRTSPCHSIDVSHASFDQSTTPPTLRTTIWQLDAPSTWQWTHAVKLHTCSTHDRSDCSSILGL